MGTLDGLLWRVGLVTRKYHEELAAYQASRIEDYSKRLNESTRKLDTVGDLLAEKTLELESLKKKIIDRAQTPPIIKAKTAAEIRRFVEAQNERELEEQTNGI